LLKLLASIYRADHGRIRVAGRLAPFIELGVGMNPELTARENVALNGVMMGLGRHEAARRLDAVLEFAELQEYVDLKLKNYSSGMNVRLAFSVMLLADPDVMLIDEVLAVGDAAFAEKCLEVFREKRRSGKTVVLVTHDMMTVQSFCDRAMLLHDGEQRYLGDPDQAVLRYYRVNFGGDVEDGAVEDDEPIVSLFDVWLEDADGKRIENPVQGQSFRFNLLAEAHQDLKAPAFGFQVLNVNGVSVFGFGKPLRDEDDEPVPIARGQRVRVVADINGQLVAGRYSVRCSVARSESRGDAAMTDVPVADIVIKGTEGLPGMVVVQSQVEATIEQGVG
jgi:ABC-type polysaccharide/polyol phosphate transport system ATPase subunit